ncbi:glycosyltransferase family 32 [Fusarium albosuccineum]|uniref:Glycosyltransferase family 32 n=1 Tax=Fusarium albosuccineum TaxID=1237068 RepID=A0A8H4LN87_9HYPO|nr:glycosyltransferase family 32 [Fusarium albosuccineum]
MASGPRRNLPANLRIPPSTVEWTVTKKHHDSKHSSPRRSRDIEKMGTPLGSPTLAASTAKFRNKVPAQMQRCLPLYIGCVFFLLIILNFDVFYSISNPVRFIWPEPEYTPPPARGSTFPQKIWQTWKVDPLNYEDRELVTSRTWLAKNPGMRYEVLTDSNEMAFVETHFGTGPNGLNRPDIVKFYRQINLPIIKADLLRYMIMYAQGGVYADIDVEALRPVHRFIPERYNEEDIDLIVGVEIDQPEFSDHPILGKKSKSFCQWTIIAKPRQPVMLKLIENIMAWLIDVAKQQKVPLGEVQLDFDQVISGTGPSAFTSALLEQMNQRSKGPKVTWDLFHNMYESKVVGRVLVLDVEAFCAGQGHSDSGNHDSRGALVKHHYHASNWPSRHPRFSHPVYGQVEDCNWNAECVRLWDENVTEYEKLSEEEKKTKIDEAKKPDQQ